MNSNSIETNTCSDKWMSFYQVADSRGHTLFRKEDASKGKFAFTTEDYELFEVCFLSTVTGEPRLKVWQVYAQVGVFMRYHWDWSMQHLVGTSPCVSNLCLPDISHHMWCDFLGLSYWNTGGGVGLGTNLYAVLFPLFIVPGFEVLFFLAILLPRSRWAWCSERGHTHS